MAKNQTLELSILIGGHVDNSLTQAVKSANTQLSSMANGASKLAANIAKVTVGIASGITAGLVDATKEAVAFESEMLDVTKYVGGLTDANGKVKTDAYAEMSKDILDLSTQIPYTAKELTRLAAAAGQSGKSMDDLISGGFLKDVAEMGTAMDISADQAGDWAAKWEVASNMQNSKKLFGAKTPAGMAKATSALFGSIQQAQASGGIIGLLKGSSIGQYGARVARSAKNLAGTDFIQNTVGVGRWLGQKVTGTQLGGFVGNMGQKAMGFGQGLLGGAKNIAGTAIGGVKNLAGRAASTKVGQYTDSGSDSSDSLSIKVNAMDHKWINSWMPDKEAVLHPTLCTTNWIVQGDRTVLDCGTLVVDDLSFSACPDVLTIGAVARPNGTSFHEKNREQVWKNTSIKRIAETIAGRYGLECKMDAEDVSVALKEQDDNDSSFLQKICSTYGLILKTYRNKIWIFDREQYKKKDSVATVKPIDIVPGSLSWNTTLAGTYTGGEFTYSNQKKKVNIKVTIGTADRMLKLNQYASSEADAKRQLQAAIDNKNHSATTISFTTMGNLTYCATQCIDVEGYGKIDGKYYMDSVGHTMNKSGGFVTKVSASRVGG